MDGPDSVYVAPVTKFDPEVDIGGHPRRRATGSVRVVTTSEFQNTF
jgi:hypothetical protein